MPLPDLFLAGAPKAGTTALHVALARHPQLFMSRVKEPKFFLTEGEPRPQRGPGDARTVREQVWQRERVRGAVRRRAARHPAGRVDLALPARRRRAAADPATRSPTRA